jgi:hypothetical protein
MLYIEFVVALFMPLLTTIQLFVDKFFSILMNVTLLSFVVIVTVYLM